MQPEHYDFDNPVFLPVAEHTCQRLLECADSAPLADLCPAELAAVMVIQHLAAKNSGLLDAASAERSLVKLLAWSSAGGDLLAEARRLYKPAVFKAGLANIGRLALRLLDAEAVAKGDYLTADGGWDTTFRGRHFLQQNPFTQQMVGRSKERWLTSEQDKLLRVFKANLDEDLHVQGYAGIGKSYLLSSLLDFLPRNRVLALARTQGKLATLRQRMGLAADVPFGKTFAQLFRAPAGRSRYQPAVVPQRHRLKADVAVELNVLGFRGLAGETTLDICLEVVKRYCESRHRTLSARHLPFFQQPLSSLESQVLVEYAGRVWMYLQANPDSSSLLDFHGLWLIKQANLSGEVIPAHYTHVIIDESQDIPASLLQIIEKGRHVLVTLGDEYQKARGDVVARKRQVRQRDIAFSVRSGVAVERSVNALICRHSNKSKLAFETASSADLRVEFYPENQVPPKGCAVLTASPWDTMRWALVYSESRAIAFSDAGDAQYAADEQRFQNMAGFMEAVVALFKPGYYAQGDGRNSVAHPYFAHMSTWQQVRDANRFDDSFLWVEARLQSGFNRADLTTLKARINRHPDALLLMMAEDAGGMEFERVMLTPELMSVNPFSDAYEFDSRICAVYIALSRARSRLYLPYDVEEWIDYHKSRPYRDVYGH